jgi:DNA polymerase III alpha subunit (gram-positive type)
MYLAMDLETGGLGREVSLLTGYFCVLDRDFNATDELELNLIPDDGIYKVQPEGLAVNKIDLVELAKTAVPYKEAKTILYRFLDYNAMMTGDKLIPIGQNVFWDIDVIQNTLLSIGSWESKVSYRVIDTMYIARFLQMAGKLNIEKVGLQNLIEYFKVEVNGNLHEAKYDTLATVEVYKKLLELVK